MEAHPDGNKERVLLELMERKRFDTEEKQPRLVVSHAYVQASLPLRASDETIQEQLRIGQVKSCAETKDW